MNVADRTLFERLEATTDDRPIAPSGFDASLFSESVLSNVRLLLNERRGSCEIRPDYGMPDLNDVMGHGGNPTELGRIIRSLLETFEPRLKDVTVRFTPDPDNPLSFRYRISAMLRTPQKSERIAFDTIMSDDKRVKVRR